MNLNIFDTLLEPVFVLNSMGRVQYCNSAASAIIGLSERRIIRANHLLDVLSFSEEISYFKSLESQVQEPTPYRELEFISSSGKKGKAQITLQPIYLNPEQKAYLVFFRDVTLEETLQLKYRAELKQKEVYIGELEKARLELQDYSQNLEKMVEQRTFELHSLNQMMKALLDSLSEGFFVFNADGFCLPVSSKACEHLLEKDPKGKNIWEVLALKPEKIDGFKKWMLTVFSEMLPFEDLAPLAPVNYAHSRGLHIKLSYFPMRDESGKIEAVVVVATDTTYLDEAREQAEREKAFAQMVINMVKKKKEFANFIIEARKLFLELSSALNSPSQFDLDHVFRLIHTIKGGVATFSLMECASYCHHAEELISKIKWGGFRQAEYDKLKSECQRAFESFNFFINQNIEILGHHTLYGERMIDVPWKTGMRFLAKLEKMGLRQMAFEFEEDFLFTSFHEFIRPYQDLVTRISQETGKKIQSIQIHNASFQLNPDIYNELFSTLVHQFRNAVDHGIEEPSKRKALGKNEAGKISASIESFEVKSANWVRIIITDDGGGINPDIVRNKLKAKGLDTSKETDDQVIQHVFDSQFSTRDHVTDLSGRGVGMDAILFAALNLGGTAFIRSKLNQGTSLVVEVPLMRRRLDLKREGVAA